MLVSDVRQRWHSHHNSQARSSCSKGGLRGTRYCNRSVARSGAGVSVLACDVPPLDPVEVLGWSTPEGADLGGGGVMGTISLVSFQNCCGCARVTGEPLLRDGKSYLYLIKHNDRLTVTVSLRPAR